MLLLADSATPHAEIDTDVAEPEQDINNTTSPNTITPLENIIDIKDATYEDMQLIIKIPKNTQNKNKRHRENHTDTP
jgi:hypothetical protein